MNTGPEVRELGTQELIAGWCDRSTGLGESGMNQARGAERN